MSNYLKFLGLNIKNGRPSVFEMIQKNFQIFSFSLFTSKSVKNTLEKKTIKDYDNGRKKKPLKKYEKLKKTKNIQSCVN